MKRKLTAAMALMLLVGAVQAHTHLESSAPADKSRVKAPQAIELHFNEPARLTSLTLQRGREAAKSLTVPAKAAKDIAVPVAGLTAGEYKVAWRIASADGHVMSGSFAFTVDPAASSTTSKPAAPAHDHGDGHHH